MYTIYYKNTKNESQSIPVLNESKLTILLKESLGGNSICAALGLIDEVYKLYIQNNNKVEEVLKVLILLQKMKKIKVK